MAKYEVVEDDPKSFHGRTVFRIRRLSDGKLGGFVEGEHNLSQSGECFVHKDGIVAEHATVREDAQVYGLMRGSAQAYGSATVIGQAAGNSIIADNAKLYGQITDNAKLIGNATLYGMAKGNAVIRGKAVVYGSLGGNETAE